MTLPLSGIEPWTSHKHSTTHVVPNDLYLKCLKPTKLHLSSHNNCCRITHVHGHIYQTLTVTATDKQVTGTVTATDKQVTGTMH